jgi:hypothetical protein
VRKVKSAAFIGGLDVHTVVCLPKQLFLCVNIFLLIDVAQT